MGLLGHLLGRDEAHREDPSQEEQLAELHSLGLELRRGRDPDAALPARLSRRDPCLTPYYRYFFNGAVVPSNEVFQAGPVTGSRAVQLRLDGAGRSLDEPPARPLEAAEVEARASVVAAALATDLAAARRLGGVAVRWDRAAQRGRADLSIDHHTTSVQIGDGHLKHLALAVASALTPDGKVTLAFPDPLDVTAYPHRGSGCSLSRRRMPAASRA